MIDPIIIKWDTGAYELHPDFFPISMPKTRKLFKMLLQDENWSEDKIRELGDTLKEVAQKKFELSKTRVRESEQTAALAKSIKPHKRNTLDWGDSAWLTYVKTRDLAKLQASDAKRYEREGHECLKTRLLLFEMTGVSASE